MKAETLTPPLKSFEVQVESDDEFIDVLINPLTVRWESGGGVAGG